MPKREVRGEIKVRKEECIKIKRREETREEREIQERRKGVKKRGERGMEDTG